MFAYFVSDDLLRDVPPRAAHADRPARHAGDDGSCSTPTDPTGVGYEGASQYQPMTDPAARVAWMDERGIAHQNVISGAGYTLARAIDDPGLGRRALEAVNTWMADAAGDHRDRLRPVTSLRFDDLDWVVAELTRMRERREPGVPRVGRTGRTASRRTTPTFDKVWSAATDLGMIAHLHVGMSPALIHPGWANTDDPAIIRLLSVHAAAPEPRRCSSPRMVFGGVFERHPEAHRAVLRARHRLVRPAVERIDAHGHARGEPARARRLPLAAARRASTCERNVRISPIPAPHQSPRRAAGGTCPRSRCSRPTTRTTRATPIRVAYYDAGARRRRRRRHVTSFLGGNIAASYARMGDPL